MAESQPKGSWGCWRPALHSRGRRGSLNRNRPSHCIDSTDMFSPNATTRAQNNWQGGDSWLHADASCHFPSRAFWTMMSQNAENRAGGRIASSSCR